MGTTEIIVTVSLGLISGLMVFIIVSYARHSESQSERKARIRAFVTMIVIVFFLVPYLYILSKGENERCILNDFDGQGSFAKIEPRFDLKGENKVSFEFDTIGKGNRYLRCSILVNDQTHCGLALKYGRGEKFFLPPDNSPSNTVFYFKIKSNYLIPVLAVGFYDKIKKTSDCVLAPACNICNFKPIVKPGKEGFQIFAMSLKDIIEKHQHCSEIDFNSVKVIEFAICGHVREYGEIYSFSIDDVKLFYEKQL